MQRTSGLYRLTQIPKVYEAFQEILAGSSMRARLVREFLQPRPGERILDIGCGSAAVLPYLGDVRYHGIDANPDHIAQARERHGARGTFSVGDIAAAAALQEGAYDSVYSIGVYHHLDDDRLRELAEVGAARLAPRGRLIGIDPAYVDGQHWIARRLAAADSGRCVRSPEGYRNVLAQVFGKVDIRVCHDLLRVPYTHCVSVAST